MIKTDKWLLEHGPEIFFPFNPEQVNPASYDLKLDNRFIDLHSGKSIVVDEILLEPPKLIFNSIKDQYSLEYGSAVLASTWEYIKLPNGYTATVFLKSSMARLGLDHALAGWVDPGFEGNLTLELHAHRGIKLLAGQRVVQLVIEDADGLSENPYAGKYKGQTGPTIAR